MRLLAFFILLPSLALGAPTLTRTPTRVPTPEHEINLESYQVDRDGADMQWRYISPDRKVKAWDTMRVLRLNGESDKALYLRATTAVAVAVAARKAELEAVSRVVAKPTPTLTKTAVPR